MKRTLLSFGILASFFATLLLPLTTVSADTTVRVSGNTVNEAAGENNSEGWWFNRDPRNATPIEFNLTKKSIGNGALYVKPVSTEPARKFVGEFFVFDEMKDVSNFSVDYMIAGNGTTAKSSEFYLNVYANFEESDTTKYFDCRYDVTASQGSVSGFSTLEFSTSEDYAVVRRGDSPRSTCPASPLEMGENATIRMISVNMGDTDNGDAGLAGYFDNAVYTAANETTVYDFDPYPTNGQITAPTPNQVVAGSTLNLSASYDDGDNNVNDDSVQWAVRKGVTCDGATNTIAGNVDGFRDLSTWTGSNFSAVLNISGLDAGEYCFIFNPRDDVGQNDVRETRTFSIQKVSADSKDECKNGGWENFQTKYNNQGDCVSSVASTDKAKGNTVVVANSLRF